MTNKKGQEISINVVVGIIMGLVMLGAGIALFIQIVDKSEQTTLEVDQAIQEKYMSVFNDGDALFLPYTKGVYKGKALQFYYGIHNTNDVPTDFNVEIESLDDQAIKGNIYNSNIQYLNTIEKEIPARDKIIRKFIVQGINGLSKGQHLIMVNITEVTGPGTTKFYTHPRTISVTR